VLTLAGLNVLLAADATAGMQVKAIAQDRMKVMRRMAGRRFGSVQPRHAVAQSDGHGMPDYSFARCDRHHETVDFRLRKMTRARKKAPDVPGLQVVSNKGESPRGT
jgi:hypothetical protein